MSKEQKSDAIYSIPCNDCNQEYIGQTKRQFGTRLKEHQKAVALSRKDNSALSEHTCQTNHTIAWNNSKIITTNQRYHQRRCLEAWHINSAHAPLNRDDGGLLPDAYLHLINQWCHYSKSSIKGNSLRRSDHPWWRHQTGVSKRWVLNCFFFKLRSLIRSGLLKLKLSSEFYQTSCSEKNFELCC